MGENNDFRTLDVIEYNGMDELRLNSNGFAPMQAPGTAMLCPSSFVSEAGYYEALKVWSGHHTRLLPQVASRIATDNLRRSSSSVHPLNLA